MMLLKTQQENKNPVFSDSFSIKVWMIRYSEMFLKSEPVRRHWENVLIKSINSSMPKVLITRERGRIWAEGEVDTEKLKNIFGIFSFSECEKTSLESLSKSLISFCEKKDVGHKKTFAIRVKREGNHSFSSADAARECGSFVHIKYPHLRVDLKNPELEIHVEIRGENCYIFDKIEKGAGGIPPGVEGSLVSLMSGGIDSPVAAYLMMKRGCRIIPLYIGLAGFLDETNLKRAEAVVESLRRFQPDMKLIVVNDTFLSKAKEILVKSKNERYTCLICKRRMYRIAAEVAAKKKAKGFVTGEAMGQVASQTLDNLLVLDDAVKIPVYRPLIGFDKEDVIKIAREIKTFESSTAPASGCSAVPKKPSTCASMEDIKNIEKNLTIIEDNIIYQEFNKCGQV